MGENRVDYQILVIGKTGNGKSALCNTLVGEDMFPTGRSLAATTLETKYATKTIDGCKVTVIDTPDITNCNMSPQQQKAEVSKWKQIVSGNPRRSVVLLAIRCDVRYTHEEFLIYQEIKRLWGDGSLKKRLFVAFTFGDSLDGPVEETVRKPPPELKKILKKAGRRYIVTTNKAGSERSQAKDLLPQLNQKRKRGCL